MKSFLRKNTTLLLSTLFLTFTLVLFAPFEIYLTNRTEFWFTLGMFWWIIILVFVLAYIVIAFPGLLLRGKLKQVYELLVFSFAICFYLQGNFFNLKLGLMTGERIDWSLYSDSMIKDLIIWGLIIILLFLINRKPIFDKIRAYVCAFFVAIQSVALISLLIPAVVSGEESSISDIYLTDDHEFEISSNENTIVLILDMFDDSYFKDILEISPEIKDVFDGFTYFNNNTGLYSTTMGSTIALFNGRAFYNELPEKEWKDIPNRIYIDEFLDSGYEFNAYSYFYWNLPSHILANTQNVKSNYKMTFVSNYSFVKRMYRLIMCKYFPNILKPYIWLSDGVFENLGEKYNMSNSIFRDKLDSEGLTLVSNKQLKYIHIDGAHDPYYIDSMGNDVPEYDGDEIQVALGSLRLASNYLDCLKQLGVYDSTAIIIMADHGYYREGVLSNPLFLVKPKNSHGMLQINNSPVCQEDFAATILDISNISYSSDYGKSVFEYSEGDSRIRHFYQYNLSEGNLDRRYRMIEYSIPNYSNDTSNFELTGREYAVTGEVIDHSKYCISCQEKLSWDTSGLMPTLIHKPSKDNPSYPYISVEY